MNEPAAHALQVSLPAESVPFAAKPRSHTWQAVEPALSVDLPPPQGMQAAAEAAPSRAWCVPMGQPAAAVPLQYFPAGHGSHDLGVAAVWTVPAGQLSTPAPTSLPPVTSRKAEADEAAAAALGSTVAVCSWSAPVVSPTLISLTTLLALRGQESGRARCAQTNQLADGHCLHLCTRAPGGSGGRQASGGGSLSARCSATHPEFSLDMMVVGLV